MRYIVNDDFLAKVDVIPLDGNSNSDYECFKYMLQDKDTASTMSVFNGRVGSEEQIRIFFNTVTCKDKEVKICLHKVFYDNELAGIVGLYNAFEYKGVPAVLELGYFLKREFRNRRITSRISEILIEDIFNKFPNAKIVAGNLVSNKISQTILLRLGFKFKTKMINRYDAIVNRFELFKSDFENRHNSINIERELRRIEIAPETNIRVEGYIL